MNMWFGLERETAREITELGAVFVILGGLLGFLHEQGFGSDAVIGAIGGGLLFALILSVGALFGMSGRKT
jgi:hypothetical protein